MGEAAFHAPHQPANVVSGTRDRPAASDIAIVDAPLTLITDQAAHVALPSHPCRPQHHANIADGALVLREQSHLVGGRQVDFQPRDLVPQPIERTGECTKVGAGHADWGEDSTQCYVAAEKVVTIQRQVLQVRLRRDLCVDIAIDGQAAA
ncbi:hypothetical protein [Ralstonia flaminis]|jgi:hypothetical protein|uniref:Uncharacterized protein n=1 Tax=Ralstonia flaminis TaxID=3058597 RepID=A0ABN9JNY0_9RALS|nr:hypothetical protein [Ralstonia sp. LMG 18101]CAJ0815232.1 hypothetical protein LMG18101_02518 [Ralstonia sp. LMG 18101]